MSETTTKVKVLYQALCQKPPQKLKCYTKLYVRNHHKSSSVIPSFMSETTTKVKVLYQALCQKPPQKLKCYTKLYVRNHHKS